MKQVKRLIAVIAAILSFFTTVLCMRDVFAARDDLQQASGKTGKENLCGKN